VSAPKNQWQDILDAHRARHDEYMKRMARAIFYGDSNETGADVEREALAPGAAPSEEGLGAVLPKTGGRPKNWMIENVNCFCCGKRIEGKNASFHRDYCTDMVMLVAKCCGLEERRDFTRERIMEINAAGGWTAFLR
jgi:hypothetical protein